MSDEERNLRAFVELTSRLLGEVGLEEALQLVADAALELMPGEQAIIRVLDPSRTKVLSAARAGRAELEDPLPFKLGAGVLGRVVAERRSARIDDLGAEAGATAVRSVLAAPLLSGGEVVGLLDVTARATGAFEERDSLTSMLLANCAAPVVERARLERLSVTDQLTLAFNARYLLPRLKEEVSRSQRYNIPLSLIMMDLDDFRRVNEVHGHPAGDVVLQRFADRVRATVRLSDVLVRTGGEEFALIATNTPLDAAVAVWRRVRERLAAEPLLEDRHGTAIKQTVTMGVAAWNGTELARDLDARAVAALRKAQSTGRDALFADGVFADESGDGETSGPTG